MAILQALVSFIGKSAGKILNAIFGWAVVALFGRSSPKEQTLLSGLVAAAAAWPLLLLGVVVPKITTFLIAFVPLSQKIPSWIIRVVWALLALAVPIAVGLVVASKAPPGTPREPFSKRLLRGFPITFGIAASFFLMFVTVPVLRLISAAKGRKDDHVPSFTEGDDYQTVAAQIEYILKEHDLDATRAEPSWWLSAPSKVLQKLAGKALRGFMPEDLAYWSGPALEIALYPSDILIRGKNKETAWTHGVLAEELAHGPSLQTFDPEAQELERQIRSVWGVYDEHPIAHQWSKSLLSRLTDIARELGHLKIDYEEWQVLYRQVLQLARALHGEPQLLQSLASSTETQMEEKPMGKDAVDVQRPLATPRTLESASTMELIGRFARESRELVKKEIELARAEARADVRREIKTAEGLGVAGVCALLTLNLLLVAVVLTLAQWLPAWASALIVAAVVLSIGTVAGIIGWRKRVRKPLEKTQKTIKEDVRWAKERIA